MPIPTDTDTPTPDDTPTPTDTPAVDAALVSSLSGMFSAVGVEESNPGHLVGHAEAKFFLRFMPGLGNWEPATVGLDGSFMLPILGKHILSPGAVGVRTRTRHQPELESYRRAFTRAREEGWQYLIDEAASIPPELLPPAVVAAARMAGKSPGGYLQRAKTRGPGPGQPLTDTYLEAWQLPLPTRPHQKRTRFSFDNAGYNRFRLWLVVTGRVSLPMAGEMDERQSGMLRALRIAETASGPPAAVKRVVSSAKAAITAASKAQIPAVA
jgi:hypothetical protein